MVNTFAQLVLTSANKLYLITLSLLGCPCLALLAVYMYYCRQL